MRRFLSEQPLVVFTLICFSSLIFASAQAAAADRLLDCLSPSSVAADNPSIVFLNNPLFEDDFSLDIFGNGAADNAAGSDTSLNLCLSSHQGESLQDKSLNPQEAPPLPAPSIDKTDIRTNIFDGDYMDAYGSLKFSVIIQSSGTIKNSDVVLVVKDPSSFLTPGTSSASCSRLFANPVGYQCDVEWKWIYNIPQNAIRNKLTAGLYTARLTATDSNGISDAEEWQLEARDTLEFSDVMSGPGLFDPRSGSPVRIAFQAPLDNMRVRLDIYDRRGVLAYTYSDFVNSGYNEMTWDGVVREGGYAGNGVYLFKLTSEVGGVKTSASGKIAVYKK